MSKLQKLVLVIKWYFRDNLKTANCNIGKSARNDALVSGLLYVTAYLHVFIQQMFSSTQSLQECNNMLLILIKSFFSVTLLSNATNTQIISLKYIAYTLENISP